MREYTAMPMVDWNRRNRIEGIGGIEGIEGAKGHDAPPARWCIKADAASVYLVYFYLHAYNV